MRTTVLVRTALDVLAGAAGVLALAAVCIVRGGAAAFGLALSRAL